MAGTARSRSKSGTKRRRFCPGKNPGQYRKIRTNSGRNAPVPYWAYNAKRRHWRRTKLGF
ncbi:hypothetical protein IMY05_017G0034800 [Salix suchowensis]|nr:hypothetical protein IMY05_017G0034800 [Salix suchowensis]